ncbi:MAG TPA: CRISPR system precrRNA processing endoribonuclease RAMP protein Cas6 [Bryobacteraceae bacterium]|nr:CRISPR system precrRNA processing endoribonuclease RAMP protein Cas6 [Bryobacteraceae bacterium]
MTFDVLPVRFEFTAKDPIHFAPGTAGNILRGAFGMALRSFASPGDYARIFEPAGAGPSGLADHPRPFVFRVSHLDGKQIRAGEQFRFDVNLFETSPTCDSSLPTRDSSLPTRDSSLPSRDREGAVPIFTRTFETLAAAGLGRTRARAELTKTTAAPAISIPFDAPVSNVTRIRVEFKTPTELKSEGRLIDKPSLAILFARIRDRISTLRALYGPGPLEIDFRAIGERASQIRLTRCDIHHVDTERRSTRTGQTHGIGGFVGVAEYEGELGEFLPYLEAARYTGVGRHCVWGNGELSSTHLPPPTAHPL